MLKTIRPFDQTDRRFKCIDQANFVNIVRSAEAVQVHVPQRIGTKVVFLNKRERWRWYVFPCPDFEQTGLDQSAREEGFSAAQRTV